MSFKDRHFGSSSNSEVGIEYHPLSISLITTTPDHQYLALSSLLLNDNNALSMPQSFVNVCLAELGACTYFVKAVKAV